LAETQNTKKTTKRLERLGRNALMDVFLAGGVLRIRTMISVDFREKMEWFLAKVVYQGDLVQRIAAVFSCLITEPCVFCN
jgi:hypothetical protein